MRHSSSLVRPLALVLLVVSVAGCSWFKKGAKGDYALAPEARPLEVPPDLNLPNTSGAMQVPNVGPAASSAGATANAAGGIRVDTEAAALAAGANILVVGRAITRSKDIRDMAEQFMTGLKQKEIDQYRVMTDF